MKKKLFLMPVLAFFCNLFNLFATNYFIDPINGNDSNNGLVSSNAFKSLSKIDQLDLLPGDIVYFMEGTYTRPGQTLLTINESGTAENPITFKNYQNDKPIFEFDSWVGIDIIGGSSYLVFDGLTVKGARTKVNLEDAINQPAGCAVNFEGNPEGLYNGTGILAVGPNLLWSNAQTNSVPHHITINNCEVYDCTSSGVAFQQADYITITNNKIYDNCWYTTYGTSGINFYQFVNTDGTTGFHNKVSNNLMYGNQLLVPQIAGGCAFHDGNGFIADDFNHTQTTNYKDVNAAYDAYSAKTLISNNVSVENGGSGLHFFLSSNCYIYNNTVANNTFQNGGDNSNGEIRIGRCSQFEVKNNIFKSEYTVHSYSLNSNIDYTNNYQFGPDININLVDCEGCISDNEITFLNTDVNNATPYITDFSDIYTDAGIIITEIIDDYIGNARPYGESYDLGAYELSNCDKITWYADIDGDGLGNEEESVFACEQPEEYVAKAGDLCNEDSNKIEPGECGCGIEEGTCDEVCEEPTTWYADIDGDGLGNLNDTIVDCEQPEGYVIIAGDLCNEDPNKTEPGECGCGVEEGTCDETPEDLCDSPEYNSSTIYDQDGITVIFEGLVYQNLYYTIGNIPTAGAPWVLLQNCSAELADCSIYEEWSSNQSYPTAGTQVSFNQKIYQNKWYASGNSPEEDGAWELIGFCNETAAKLFTSNSNFNAVVYNLNGQAVSNYTSSSTKIETNQLSYLGHGIYIVQFTDQVTGEIFVEKIAQ